MSFAALPWWALALAASTAVAIVVALYLLRRTPPRRVVSNVTFWARALERARPRVLRATQIPIVALLVTLLVALLLVAEIGDPRFGEGVRGTTVIVVGAGQSMSATEGGSSRLEQALREAQAWADRATSRGEAALVRAGIRPEVLVPLSEHTADFAAAIEARGARADDGPADLDGAIALADAIVRARGGAGQIVLIADTQATARVATPVVLVPIGDAVDTIAVAAIVARRDPLAVGEYAVRVDVRSHTSRRATGKLVVRDRDVVLFERPFELGPYEARPFTGHGFSSAQGELVATLEDIEIAGSEDRIAADDTAYAVAAALPRTSVLLVSPGSPWLDAALETHGALDVDRVRAAPRTDLGDHDVVVFDRVAPPPGARYRGALVLGAPSGSAVTRTPRVSATLAGHPALGGLRLDSLRIESAHAIEPEPGDAVLIRSGATVLGVARERSGVRTVELGFDVGRTSFVDSVAFPLFVHYAIAWLAHNDREGSPFARAPGEPITTTARTVLGPAAQALEAHAGAVDDTSRAGIYRAGARAIAYSSRASGTRPPAIAAVSERDLGSSLPPLAVIVAVVLLLVILIEWTLMHRGRLT